MESEDEESGEGDYTAADIRVLDMQEVEDRFAWVKAENLAEQYNRPLEWVLRGIEACRRGGLPGPEYFIARYLKKDRSVTQEPAVDLAMRELNLEAREGAWGEGRKQ